MIIKPLSANTKTNKNYVTMDDSDIGKTFKVIATGFKDVPATTVNGMDFSAHREQFYEDHNFIYVTKFYDGKGTDIVNGNEYTLVCKASKTGKPTLYCNMFNSAPLEFQKFSITEKVKFQATRVEVISIKPTTGQYAQPGVSQVILKWCDKSNKAFSINKPDNQLPKLHSKYILAFEERQNRKGSIMCATLTGINNDERWTEERSDDEQ